MAYAIRYLGTPRTRWRWVGRGEIALEGEQIILRGRRHRWFMPGRRQEVTLARADVYNVGCEGALVHCQVRLANAPEETLRFGAQNAAAAQALVAQMPTERTPAFSQEQSQREQFNQALSTLSPRAIVAPALVAINVVVFLGTLADGAGLFASDPSVLLRWGSNFGPATLEGQWWRLFTAMFLHFGLVHLLFNMLGLWSLGSLTERLFGWRSFLFIYLASGLCASLASLWWHPLLNCAGASGAIFGVLGALLAFMVNPRTRIAPHIAKAQRNSALIFIAYNLLNGATHVGIDNAAHIGGLLAGLVLGWALALPLEAEVRETHGRRLALTAMVAMVMLAGCGYGLQHVHARSAEEQPFVRQLSWFLREDLALLYQQVALARLSDEKTIDQRQLAERVRGALLPRWQDAGERMEATALPRESKLIPLREKVVAYIGGQCLGLELFAKGILNHNPEKLKWGNEALGKAPERRQEIATLSRDLY
jgi:rhomboid protease GluP